MLHFRRGSAGKGWEFEQKQLLFCQISVDGEFSVKMALSIFHLSQFK